MHTKFTQKYIKTSERTKHFFLNRITQKLAQLEIISTDDVFSVWDFSHGCRVQASLDHQETWTSTLLNM